MNVLVTGGCGFLGSSIVKKLIYKGFNVKIFDNSISNNFKDIEIIEGDIRDYDSIRKAIRSIDIVFHTAAIVSFDPSKKKIQEEINITGTKNVMQVCLENEVQRIIHTSSINAIGFSKKKEILDESAHFNWKPYNLTYMNSKYEAEKIIIEMERFNKLPVVIVNPGTIFGKSNFHNISANEYIINISKNKIPFYPKGGTNCVGIDDVVEGHILAMEKGKLGQKYILGGDNYTYRELFNIIARELNVIPPLLPLSRTFGFFVSDIEKIISLFNNRNPLITKEMIIASSFNSFFSSEKAKSELGYTYKPFKNILIDTIKYLKEIGKI